MPLTYNDTTKVITAEYIVGDAKGNSLANAWTVDDFQSAMVAAGHGAKWTQQGNQHLITGVSVSITGVGTYVHFYNSAIQWGGTSAQAYLLRVINSAHFESGSETISTFSPKAGCMFIDGVTNSNIQFYFDAYVNIYDSVFTCTKNIDAKPRPYVIYVRGNFADAILFKRCLFLNSEYFASYFGTAGSNYDNISYINCSSNQSRYGIRPLNIAGNQLYCPGLNVIGQFCDTVGTVGTRKFYDINSPSGDFRIRTGGGISTDQFVDSVVNIILSAVSGVVVGSKAIAEFYSRFNFYITNGLGANVKVYDKNDLLVFNDDIIDAGGELLNQEIMYYQYSRDVLTIVPAVTYDITDEYYYPFRVVITKAGRQILEIDDIEITDCIQTIIRGELIYLTLQISAVTITDCTAIGASDGQLEITAEGGDTNYTYSINGTDYQVSNTFSGLSAGDYTVYVKDGEDTVADFDVDIRGAIQYIRNTLSGGVSSGSLKGKISPSSIKGRVIVKNII